MRKQEGYGYVARGMAAGAGAMGGGNPLEMGALVFAHNVLGWTPERSASFASFVAGTTSLAGWTYARTAIARKGEQEERPTIGRLPSNRESRRPSIQRRWVRPQFGSSPSRRRTPWRRPPVHRQRLSNRRATRAAPAAAAAGPPASTGSARHPTTAAAAIRARGPESKKGASPPVDTSAASEQEALTKGVRQPISSSSTTTGSANPSKLEHNVRLEDERLITLPSGGTARIAVGVADQVSGRVRKEIDQVKAMSGAKWASQRDTRMRRTRSLNVLDVTTSSRRSLTPKV